MADDESVLDRLRAAVGERARWLDEQRARYDLGASDFHPCDDYFAHLNADVAEAAELFVAEVAGGV